MPDLKTFARRIRDRGKRIEENADKVVVLVAASVSQAVIVATPVDTGRARANWQASVGSPITEELSSEDPSGQDTINGNRAVISGRRGGQTIYISNNVSYINALNEGSSAQAPAGFVEQATLAGIRALQGAKLV